MAENLEAPTSSQAIESVKTVIADDGSGKAVSSNAPAPLPLQTFPHLARIVSRMSLLMLSPLLKRLNGQSGLANSLLYRRRVLYPVRTLDFWIL